ncbi:transmembrane protein 268 [Salarias fasciatus]|uniref:Transmembrane protein 268 n=1 Tax=Salarias fasciatus TaxID=181472 RepID=A0A672INI3_SALFA|nr:transmembrane protein 268 [Salarias fasciatus]XP_029976367.1 transmembrane protein 268 [Salarias fasciatus]
MEDDPEAHHPTEEDTGVDVQSRQTKAEPDSSSSNTASWLNGQCVLAMPSRSMFNPTFDLSLCRTVLERDGFQIPVADMEAPLRAALEVPAVRRYMVFNSAIFHFIMAPVLYMVVWCAVFSTLHLYIAVSDYWVLCLSVSLVSIFLTSAIIFILHRSNKEINLNLDVRLVQVNERMAKHKLLVGVADWVQNCTGSMKLYFVYWDMSQCLRALTETLEEQSFTSSDIQKKMKKKMSHLVLVSEVGGQEEPQEQQEEQEEQEEGGEEEQRPLLRNQDAGCSTTSSQRGNSEVTTSYSLVPDVTLPAQERAFQLLMTYSAAYVKLLVSERLPGQSHHHLPLQGNHCSTAPLCLCQYLKKKILQ